MPSLFGSMPPQPSEIAYQLKSMKLTSKTQPLIKLKMPYSPVPNRRALGIKAPVGKSYIFINSTCPQ